jgi:hypothetical protein
MGMPPGMGGYPPGMPAGPPGMSVPYPNGPPAGKPRTPTHAGGRGGGTPNVSPYADRKREVQVLCRAAAEINLLCPEFLKVLCWGGGVC